MELSNEKGENYKHYELKNKTNFVMSHEKSDLKFIMCQFISVS